MWYKKSISKMKPAKRQNGYPACNCFVMYMFPMFGRLNCIAYTVLLTFCFVLLAMMYCLQSSKSGVLYKGEEVKEQILIIFLESVNVLTETYKNYLSLFSRTYRYKYILIRASCINHKVLF